MPQETMSHIKELYRRLNINGINTDKALKNSFRSNSLKTTLECKMPTAFKPTEYILSNNTDNTDK